MVKILTIEDEDSIRNEIIDWLQFEGYEVIGAANGRLGLEAVIQHMPDLIICDIMMPEMDGYNVLLEVRSNPALTHIPFIFLTAAADWESFRQAMNLGADDYLTKPFTNAELMQAIHSRLQKYEAQQQYFEAQLKLLNQALDEERERRILKARLVGMFSHDFRNPLSVITSGATLLRDYDDRLDKEAKQKKLNRIIGAVARLTQMLDDMLFVAEMESGQFDYNPQPLDVSEVVGSIVDEFREIDLDVHRIVFQTGVHQTIVTDSRLLRQITANLMSNALKYSPAGSEIRVTLDRREPYIELMVQDAGIGIPEADLPLLFQPFYRAGNAKNIKGTGLGLAIVKQAIDLCGGGIDVASTLGTGTKFIVRLPQSVNGQSSEI